MRIMISASAGGAAVYAWVKRAAVVIWKYGIWCGARLMSANDEILVVDDEATIVAFIAELLAEEGYSIRTASNGAQALEAIAAQSPALVLLDYSMPRMTGVDVVQQLRRSGSMLPIIGMSAEEHAELFLAQGANAFLHKPFDLDTLLTHVAAHYAPPGEATLASQMPLNAALNTPDLRWPRATPPALRQVLLSSRQLRWDARWLAATSLRLQQRSLRLQQTSERLRRQSTRLLNWP
jgi:DNA-binding response OmpR family regulator